METKTIGVSGLTILAAVAASVGVTRFAAENTREPTIKVSDIKVGGAPLDRAVLDAVRLSGVVGTIHASIRASVVEGVYALHWWCDGVPCPATTAAELNKASADGVSATLTPTIVGDEVKYKAEVQRGTRPALPELLPEDAALLGIKSVVQPKEIEEP